MFYFTFAGTVYLRHNDYGLKDRTNHFDEISVYYSFSHAVWR